MCVIRTVNQSDHYNSGYDLYQFVLSAILSALSVADTGSIKGRGD